MQINNFSPFVERYKNIAQSLVTEVYSFHSKLSQRCSDMTDEMFGVITTVDAERFWRCNQPPRVSQTGTSKRRSQSFCLSVSLSPASLSAPHLSASETQRRQSIMCMVTLFLSATKRLIFFMCIAMVINVYSSPPVPSSSGIPPRSVDEAPRRRGTAEKTPNTSTS